MYVEYSSNNSGGRWWLKDNDWKALEKAGWKVAWKNVYPKSGAGLDENGLPILEESEDDGRFLGALAITAFYKASSLKEAVLSWEAATGKSSTDAGCPCCGQPHRFTLYEDDGTYVDSSPDTDYSCSW